MKPFSSPSLLLELRRLYLCHWLAAQAGTALPGCPHAGWSPTGWAGLGAVSMACEPLARASLEASIEESHHLPRAGVEASVGLHGVMQYRWAWTQHLGMGLGMGIGTKWPMVAQRSPGCSPRLIYLQTALRAQLFVSLEDFFFFHHHIMFMLQKQE